MFRPFTPVKKPIEKDTTCKVITRKSRDGRVIERSIQGECNPSQLKALYGRQNIEHETEVEE